MMNEREECHDYWLHPERANSPKRYLLGEGRSLFLLELIREHAKLSNNIMELGCNSGRNLDMLYRDGYRVLNGIELNPDAIKLLKRTFSKMAAHIKLWDRPIEDIIYAFGTNEFDLTYTLAVLEHIHPDSEFIFREMVRTSRKIITIEDEAHTSSRHCPRNYRHVFEALGMKQVNEYPCDAVEGLDSGFVARVFVKDEEV